MFHLGKQLVIRAPKLRLSAVVTGNGQSSNRNLDQNNNNYQKTLVGHNLCHKRLSSSNSQSSNIAPMKRLAGKVAVVTASTDG